MSAAGEGEEAGEGAGPDTQCVGFLDACFDNSFTLQASLEAVRDLRAELQRPREGRRRRAPPAPPPAAPRPAPPPGACELAAWGVPDAVVAGYAQAGVRRMFPWQAECLGRPRVLAECANLLYAAPTSAGKTLVAELLAVRTVLERRKKVIVILPFVSVVREKTLHFQELFSSAGVRVEGFVGSHAPPGGLRAVHVAVCTIEKANGLVNRLMDEGNVSELGAVVVDEMHLLGDPGRGYILELLLTKIKYVTRKSEDVNIQIVGMSATLPNLELLSNWLDAELYVTDFRPIPLEEYCLVGNNILDRSMNVIRRLETYENSSSEGDNIMQLCLETLEEGCSVLIFCTTKKWCENLAQSIASNFFKLGSMGNKSGQLLREQLNSEAIMEVLEQLKSCPIGLDAILKSTVSFGVAYHHAGLTFDERDIIEGAFKSGALRILVATSTLSSGVNLPARRVIIRSPIFQKQPINILTYKQMIGRAGRMGKDVKGESILICTEAERKIGADLMSGVLDPIKSCIEEGDKFMRAVLEVIASQVATTNVELELYTNCTLLFNEASFEESRKSILEETLACLVNFELVRIQENSDSNNLYIATPLGRACLSSSMAPNDGLILFCELQKARQCLVLETDLHLIYLVTPYSVSGQWGNIDWFHMLNLWESLTKAMKRVGELVGIQESFIFQCVRGTIKFANVQNKIQILKRFYTALALQDLVNEVPLGEVANKFHCCRGLLQSLQQSAATFAGMVTAFSHQLGWKNIEMLVSQFQDRLHFGIQSELLDLMKLPSLNGLRARSLFNAGYETVSSLASADVNSVENALFVAVPFQSEKGREGEDINDAQKRNKVKNIWITGHCGVTAKQAAENLINEARTYLQLEIGVTEIKWKQDNEDVSICDYSQATVVQDSLVVNNLQKNEMSVFEVTSKHSETESLKTHINEDNSILEKNETNGLKNMSNFRNNLSGNETSLNLQSFRKEFNNTVLPTNIISAIYSIQETRETLDFEEIKEFSNKLVSGQRLSDNIWSPFSSPAASPSITSCAKKNTENKTVENQKLICITRDASLFSSDDPDSPSLFDDSLAVNTQLGKLIDENNQQNSIHNITRKRKRDSDFLTNKHIFSLKDAFQSTFNLDQSPNKEIIKSDDGENIKLFYDDELNIESDSLEIEIKGNSDEEISSTQESTLFNESGSTLNMLKITRSASRYKNDATCQVKKLNCNYYPPSKKIKMGDEKKKKFWESKSCLKSKYVCIPKVSKKILQKRLHIKNNTDNYKLTCVSIGCDEYLEFLKYLDSNTDASVYLNVENRNVEIPRIGCKFIKAQEIRENQENIKEYIIKDTVLSGIGVCFGKDLCFYIDFRILYRHLNQIFEKFNTWLNRKDVNLRLHSSKFHYFYFKKCEIALPTRSLDTSVMEWLIDSDTIAKSINKLALKYCERDLTACFEANENITQNNIMSINLLTCAKAWAVWNIAEEQLTYLREEYDDFYKVLNLETHIARILSESESCGVYVDKVLASQLLVDVKKTQEVLQGKAYKLCGRRINLNSSKDVAKALGIYKGRKVSTKKSVLSSHNTPLSNIILYWRKLNAILTKTLYPLTAKAVLESENSRIYASYVTHTCTGRVCMHEPNLQNVPRNFTIPVNFLTDNNEIDCNDVMEFSCRNIFKVTPGWVIVSADYCQLEMRILTHMCEDIVLTTIMNSDVDVFKAIASSWGGVPEDHVDDDLRQRAKQLCYGIIYGMGNKSLSQQLDVSELEASVFMDTFHRTYPAIKTFTKKIIDECRQKGYIETLKKRRRYFPNINSLKTSERNSAERQAVNTTIQGTAADIAKSAMCAVDEHVSLCGESNNVHLMLQLHDELIYEVLESRKEFFMDTLKNAMEQTVHLSVPLPVKIKVGYSWGSMEEILI